ncbi:hypothetical protein AHF37_07363, partial [Paragonimus kellicotti]
MYRLSNTNVVLIRAMLWLLFSFVVTLLGWWVSVYIFQSDNAYARVYVYAEHHRLLKLVSHVLTIVSSRGRRITSYSAFVRMVARSFSFICGLYDSDSVGGERLSLTSSCPLLAYCATLVTEGVIFIFFHLDW